AHLPRTRERAAQSSRVRGPNRRLDLLEAPEERAFPFHGLGPRGPVRKRREADADDEQEEASGPHLGSMVDPAVEPGQRGCRTSAARMSLCLSRFAGRARPPGGTAVSPAVDRARRWPLSTGGTSTAAVDKARRWPPSTGPLGLRPRATR